MTTRTLWLVVTATSLIMVWDARDLVPKVQRPALAAAIDDLRGIARIQ